MERSIAMVDRAIQRNVRIITAPRDHSVGQVGVALCTLPVHALGGFLIDVSSVAIARSPDEGWDRIPQSEPPRE
jgi:hypothetical protein